MDFPRTLMRFGAPLMPFGTCLPERQRDMQFIRVYDDCGEGWVIETEEAYRDGGWRFVEVDCRSEHSHGRSGDAHKRHHDRHHSRPRHTICSERHHRGRSHTHVSTQCYRFSRLTRSTLVRGVRHNQEVSDQEAGMCTQTRKPNLCETRIFASWSTT